MSSLSTMTPGDPRSWQASKAGMQLNWAMPHVRTRMLKLSFLMRPLSPPMSNACTSDLCEGMSPVRTPYRRMFDACGN